MGTKPKKIGTGRRRTKSGKARMRAKPKPLSPSTRRVANSFAFG